MSGSTDGARDYALNISEGSTVRTLGDARAAVTLGGLRGRGSVGRVYEVRGDAWTCAKIFDNPTPALGDKVRELADKYARGELAPRTAAWPRALLASPSGEVVGYLMDRVEGRALSEVAFRRDLGLVERARVASAWARRLSECHGRMGDPPERAIVVGDVSLANAVLDERTGEPRLVDVDAFQVAAVRGASRVLYPIRELHSRSPEALVGEVGHMALTSRHDAFLCAEGCFELLMGCDPLMGDEDEGDSDDARERVVAERRYPYLEAAREGLAPSPARVVGAELDALFAWSFCGSLNDLPSCSRYASALAELASADVRRCPTCGEEYVDRGRGCPYCETSEGLVRRASPTRLSPAPAGSAVPRVVGGGLGMPSLDNEDEDEHEDEDGSSPLAVILRIALLVGILLVVSSLVSLVSVELGGFLLVAGSAFLGCCAIYAIRS